METPKVLLLDPNPACELSGTLRRIIESNGDSIRVQQESLSNFAGSNYASCEQQEKAEGLLASLVARIKPAVIFLVCPLGQQQQTQSLVQSLRCEPPEPAVVLVSEAEEPGEMFEMLKLGAADYITPPLTPTGILPRLWRLIEQTKWGETIARQVSEKLSGTRMLIGKSPSFLEAVNKIPAIAQCNANVLISGETGTGKEVCAHAIHQLSPRADNPFIAINCGAIPVELVENELFGHERGAYTNASSSQIGQIQAAEGGALFLDEIDSLPLLAQVKLLRFLQEKEYKPLGSTRTRQADVRVITATNVNIERAVRDGKLRQDLYYRLNILPIVLPPLRERREDILMLAESFLARFAAEYGKSVKRFSPDAMRKLVLHDWPGNVRELEHVVARAVVLAFDSVINGSEITLATSQDTSQPESFQTMKDRVVEQAERTYLKSLLIAHDGNITRAAEAAQKNRRAFFELLRKHNIDARDFKGGK
jgi:DNA-binding NtrC family response regulator